MKLSTADGIRSPVRLLVNREINEAAAEDAQRRVQKACQKFLSLSIAALPALPLHEDDFGAGAIGGPRVWESPNSVFGRATLWLGRAVTDALAEARETCGRTEVRGRETRAQHAAQARTPQLTPLVSSNPIELFMKATERTLN